MVIEKIREGLYVKHSFDGYRVVYPIKNDDNSINWYNLITGGNYWKLIKLIAIVLMIYFFIWSYQHDIKAYKQIVNKLENNPYEFCMEIINQVPIQDSKLNLSIITPNG